MSDAETLAAEVTAANDEAIVFVDGCTDEQWTTVVAGPDWPVGVVLHHIAVGHLLMIDWLGRARRGEPITITAAEIDADNARHARDFASVSRAQTADDLRRNGAALAQCIAELSAEELATSVSFGPGGGMAVTAEQLAPNSTRHCRGHLDAARGALQSATA